ncbi:hypothetical protein Pelo_9682 [Pelomyxa schiedti]|nr:hypothetical protein Pelo_9682 [Pelomyxa schiedti]
MTTVDAPHARQQLLALAIVRRLEPRAPLRLPVGAGHWRHCGTCACATPRYCTLALSSALSSVTRGAKFLGSWSTMFVRPHPACPIAVDPAQAVVSTLDHDEKFSLLNMAAQRYHHVLLSEVNGRLYHYGNSRWWVHCPRSGDAMFVVDLMSQPEGLLYYDKLFHHTKVDLPRQLGEVLGLMDEDIEFMGISFSKLNPDKAVAMAIVGGRFPFPVLLRIDVRNTHSTGKLEPVLSLTKCQVERRFILSTLVMRKANGDHTFICQFPDDATSETVYEVVECVGTSKLISGDVQCLLQLTASLFCILKADQTFEPSGASTLCNSLAIGQSGFIFFKQRTKKTVDLTDVTGIRIAMLFDSNKQSLELLLQQTPNASSTIYIYWTPVANHLLSHFRDLLYNYQYLPSMDLYFTTIVQILARMYADCARNILLCYLASGSHFAMSIPNGLLGSITINTECKYACSLKARILLELYIFEHDSGFEGNKKPQMVIWHTCWSKWLLDVYGASAPEISASLPRISLMYSLKGSPKPVSFTEMMAEHITLMLAVSANGESVPPLVILPLKNFSIGSLCH